jgi:hypothetical protein
VYDRASEVFLPRKNYQIITNRDRLILDRIAETSIIARDDFHGELAFRADGDPRCECREPDLEHLADGKRRCGLRGQAAALVGLLHAFAFAGVQPRGP